MDAPGAAEIAFGVAYLGATVAWGRIFYRRVDPWLRARLGARLGQPVVWAWDAARPDPVLVDAEGHPSWASWTWHLDPVDTGTLRGAVKNWGVGLAGALATALASLVPLAALGLTYFALGFPGALVAYATFMISVPIWLYFWSGKRLPGLGRTTGDDGGSSESRSAYPR